MYVIIKIKYFGSLAYPLTYMINLYTTDGILSDKLKHARIIPLLKSIQNQIILITD